MATCGFCKTSGTTIDHVRNCAQVHYAAKSKPAAEPIVPAGRYALETDGVVKFYVVDRPESGAWKGRTFLSVLASDDKHPIKQPAAKVAILANIADDVKGAMVRYGLELGKCGRCGRTLTNAESRAAGIGPRCADKF